MSEGTAEEMWGLNRVASLLGINARSVWRRVAEGDLPKPVKVGRLARWFASDIANYQQQLREGRGGEGKAR